MRSVKHQAGVILAALGVLWMIPVFAGISLARQSELLYLLEQDCGSCHGLTRRGGLGPPLTAQALTGKPAAMLREIILNGRPGTPMPPWKGLLNEREVDWLVHVLITDKTRAR